MSSKTLSSVLLLTALCYLAAVNAQSQCAPNEWWNICGVCEGTCERLQPGCSFDCNGPPGCQCLPGYVRGADGQCTSNCRAEANPCLHTKCSADHICLVNPHNTPRPNTAVCVPSGCVKKPF
uniref:TIL domain-containing protein n=1 Tax=Steinernema glaseri TaxID=37863 RepID=A0A1I7YEZ1_9BILA